MLAIHKLMKQASVKIILKYLIKMWEMEIAENVKKQESNKPAC